MKTRTNQGAMNGHQMKKTQKMKLGRKMVPPMTKQFAQSIAIQMDCSLELLQEIPLPVGQPRHGLHSQEQPLKSRGATKLKEWRARPECIQRAQGHYLAAQQADPKCHRLLEMHQGCRVCNGR